jgi:hypothetical protein
MLLVLLGKGSSAIKAEELFDEWDDTKIGYLAKGTLVEKFWKLSNIAVDVLSDCGIGDALNYLPEVKITSYKQKIKSGQDR